MQKSLSAHDLDEMIQGKVYKQDYSKKPVIEGLQIVPLTSHIGEEGDLSEIIKITELGDLEHLPGFHIAQINRTRLNAGSIKAWHLHLEQDEIWYLPPTFELLVGLWDVRRESSTKGISMRFVMGGGSSQLIFIPHGVAHGSANFTNKNAELFYFINKRFDMHNSDEKRMPWDSLGKDFWTPEKD